MLSMHLRQIFRKPMRTVLYLLILALLTAFFCVSLNLYDNSRQNIRLAQETYSTIAVMELYADVDSRGNLIADVSTAEDYAAAVGLDKKGAGEDISVILLERMGRAVPHRMPKAKLLEELR